MFIEVISIPRLNQLFKGFTTRKNKLTQFKLNKENPLGFWLPTSEEPSKALKILIKCILQDIILKIKNFREKNVAALPTNVYEPLIKLLSPKNKTTEKDQELKIFNQESLIGNIQIPTYSQELIDCISSGAKKLNTVMGHRLIRYFTQQAFYQYVNRYPDFRVLKFDRGDTDIAEQLKLRSNKAPTNIKEIIHAMAYFEFRGPHISGNLIQLNKYKSPITHRVDEAYNIVVGLPLLPKQDQTFQNGLLLIPILKDPPLVTPNRSHAAQYLLQMLIMSEFTKQSIYLAQNGVIQISTLQWQELAQSCGITPDVLIRVKDRWIQDGINGAKFLEKIDNNYYTLGQEHKKELNFIIDQGIRRQNQSDRGKASATKRTIAKRKK